MQRKILFEGTYYTCIHNVASLSMVSLIYCLELRTLYLQGALKFPVPLSLQNIHQIN